MERVNCIICGDENSFPINQLSDRLSTNSKSFTLVKCSCSFIYINPRPDSKNIKKYYNLSNYQPHKNHSKTSFDIVYSKIQKFTHYWKFKKITKYFSTGKLLDIGGGNGEFANYMQNKGWDVTSYDKFSNNKTDIYNSIDDLNSLKSEKTFDIITMWHSIEHIHNINELFRNINRLLSPNGILYIAVPNINSIDQKFFNINWAAYDAPRHLYHFNINNLKLLCKKYNFRFYRSYSMYQDTPYNILLSYKIFNILNIFKSLILSIIIIIYIIFRGPNFSSSLLMLCKKY